MSSPPSSSQSSLSVIRIWGGKGLEDNFQVADQKFLSINLCLPTQKSYLCTKPHSLRRHKQVSVSSRCGLSNRPQNYSTQVKHTQPVGSRELYNQVCMWSQLGGATLGQMISKCLTQHGLHLRKAALLKLRMNGHQALLVLVEGHKYPKWGGPWNGSPLNNLYSSPKCYYSTAKTIKYLMALTSQ